MSMWHSKHKISFENVQHFKSFNNIFLPTQNKKSSNQQYGKLSIDAFMISIENSTIIPFFIPLPYQLDNLKLFA